MMENKNYFAGHNAIHPKFDFDMDKFQSINKIRKILR